MWSTIFDLTNREPYNAVRMVMMDRIEMITSLRKQTLNEVRCIVIRGKEDIGLNWERTESWKHPTLIMQSKTGLQTDTLLFLFCYLMLTNYKMITQAYSDRFSRKGGLVTYILNSI